MDDSGALKKEGELSDECEGGGGGGGAVSISKE